MLVIIDFLPVKVKWKKEANYSKYSYYFNSYIIYILILAKY